MTNPYSREHYNDAELLTEFLRPHTDLKTDEQIEAEIDRRARSNGHTTIDHMLLLAEYTEKFIDEEIDDDEMREQLLEFMRE